MNIVDSGEWMDECGCKQQIAIFVINLVGEPFSSCSGVGKLWAGFVHGWARYGFYI